MALNRTSLSLVSTIHLPTRFDLISGEGVFGDQTSGVSPFSFFLPFARRDEWEQREAAIDPGRPSSPSLPPSLPPFLSRFHSHSRSRSRTPFLYSSLLKFSAVTSHPAFPAGNLAITSPVQSDVIFFRPSALRPRVFCYFFFFFFLRRRLLLLVLLQIRMQDELYFRTRSRSLGDSIFSRSTLGKEGQKEGEVNRVMCVCHPIRRHSPARSIRPPPPSMTVCG